MLSQRRVRISSSRTTVGLEVRWWGKPPGCRGAGRRILKSRNTRLQINGYNDDGRCMFVKCDDVKRLRTGTMWGRKRTCHDQVCPSLVGQQPLIYLLLPICTLEDASVSVDSGYLFPRVELKRPSRRLTLYNHRATAVPTYLPPCAFHQPNHLSLRLPTTASSLRIVKRLRGNVYGLYNRVECLGTRNRSGCYGAYGKDRVRGDTSISQWQLSPGCMAW
jgi:hypothetical protein